MTSTAYLPNFFERDPNLSFWVCWTPGDPNLKQHMKKILEVWFILAAIFWLSSFFMSAIYSFFKYLCYRQTIRS